jgi:hypothetical protein
MQMSKQRVGEDVQDHATDGVKRGDGEPENPQQLNVTLHASWALRHYCYRPYDLLAALAAERLSELHCSAAPVAEHNFLLPPREPTPAAATHLSTHHL